MTRSPILNALFASAYILLIATVMTVASKIMPKPNTFMAPLAVVSLFTLSAAVMGYIFFYQPAMLYFEGKKKRAVNLFLQTVASFACVTVLIFALMFSGVFS